MCDIFLAHPFAELPGSKRMKKSQDGNMNAGPFSTDMSKAQGLGSRTTRSAKIPDARENLNLPRREMVFGKIGPLRRRTPERMIYAGMVSPQLPTIRRQAGYVCHLQNHEDGRKDTQSPKTQEAAREL